MKSRCHDTSLPDRAVRGRLWMLRRVLRTRVVVLVAVAMALLLTCAAPGMAQGPQGAAIIALLATRDAFRTRLDDLVAITTTYPARNGWAICVIEERRCETVPPLAQGSNDLAEQARGLIRNVAQRQHHWSGGASFPTIEELRLTVSDGVLHYFDRYWRPVRNDPTKTVEPADRALRLVVVADDLVVPRPGNPDLRVREASLTAGCYGSDLNDVGVADLPAEADVTLHLVVPGGRDSPARGFPPHAVAVLARVLGDGAARPGRGDQKLKVVQSASACSAKVTETQWDTTDAAGSDCRWSRVAAAPNPQAGPALDCAAPPQQSASIVRPSPGAPGAGTPSGATPGTGTPGAGIPGAGAPGAGRPNSGSPSASAPPQPGPSASIRWDELLKPPSQTATPTPPSHGERSQQATPSDAPPPRRTRPGPDPAGVSRLAAAGPALGSATVVARDLPANTGAVTVTLTLVPGAAGELHAFGPGYEGTPAINRRDAEVIVRSANQIELSPRAQPGRWRVFLRPLAGSDHCPQGLALSGQVTVQGARLAAGQEFGFEARATGCSAHGPLLSIGSFEVRQ